MSNFNKVVTNIPVSLTETEMSNLSQTFSGIIQGGGGGGEGKLYIGDGVYVTVNNDANPGVISLTQTSLDKLNKEIPSAVSSFPDSVQYAKKTYVDSTFQTKNAMSAYATTAYVSGATASIYYTNILGLVDALNAKQDTLTFGYDENDAISSINSYKLAGAGGVTGDYYSASNPSGFINSTQAETQILEKHYLTEASGNSLYVPIPQGLSDGQYYAMTTSSWKVIQGAGDVSGISTVAHDDTLTGNGNNENLGVDITKIQTKLTDAQIQNITDVTTLKTASAGWDKVSDKLDTTAFSTVSGTFLTSIPDTYATKDYANNASSNALSEAKIWVGQQGYIKQETDWTNTIQEASAKAYNDATANANSLYQAKGDYVKNTDISLDANNKITAISGKELIITAHQSLTNYYTKSQTSGANELSTEFGKYALKSEIPTVPTKVSDLTDSANYYKTTETSSKNEITNALNTKVDKPSSIQTGKLVYDGDTSDWVTLPAGTTTIVQGQDSVTANYDSSNSTYTVSLLASAENALNDVKDKIDTTAVAQTYQTKTDMANYLTTSDAATTYQPKGNYAPESVTATVNTLTAASAGWNEVTAKLDKSIYSNASGNWEASYNVLTSYSAAGKWLTAHQSLTNYYTKNDTSSKNELSTEFAKYLTTAQYNTDSATFALKTDLNGLVNSASVTTNDNYVMTNSGWKVLTLPGGGMTQVYHDTTLTGDGNANDNQLGVKWETLSSNTIAYSNSAFNLTNGTSVSSFNQISASIDDRYSKNASDERYLRKSLDNTLTGEGTNNKKLGVAWSALSGNTIVSAEKAGEAQGFRWGDNTYQDTSAALTNLWTEKNHVTLQTSNNILTVDNNDNTSATLSAMSYVNNTLNNRAFLPQKACVCLESEITTMATFANGQGMLFFVVSAH